MRSARPAVAADPARQEARRSSSRRAGQNGLADALDQPLAEAVRVHREEQHGHARARIGRLFRRELRSIAASHLHAMTDVANPVSLSAASRAHLSFVAVIDEPRRAHAERFRESVLDEDAADLPSSAPSTARGARRGSGRTG